MRGILGRTLSDINNIIMQNFLRLEVPDFLVKSKGKKPWDRTALVTTATLVVSS